ncbi:MAG: OB-fold nucleic acid binding domain-containing protein, partial [bacterium]
AARKESPFVDLFDFCLRVDKRQINRRTIESLIRAGAFDCFKVNRAILLASVGHAMEAAGQALASINQSSLFGGDDSDMVAPPEYVKVAPWSEKQKLTEEKAALGFCLSGHMFDAYAAEARQFARAKLASLGPSRDPRLMAGVISALRTQMTQRGKMIIVTLDDGSATVDVTVYSEIYDANKALFKEDEFLAVQGKVSEDRFSGGLRITAEKVMDIAAARIQFGLQLGLFLPTTVASAQIQEVLQPHRAENGLTIAVRVKPHGVDCTLCLGDTWRVAPSEALQLALEQVLGAQDVAVEY